METVWFTQTLASTYQSTCRYNPKDQYQYHLSVLGGVVVIVLATGPKVRGFKPSRWLWIFKGDKIRSTSSFIPHLFQFIIHSSSYNSKPVPLTWGYQLIFLKMEAMCSSETSVTTHKTTLPHNTKDHNPQINLSPSVKIKVCLCCCGLWSRRLNV
jgi:hypothetical protein